MVSTHSVSSNAQSQASGLSRHSSDHRHADTNATNNPETDDDNANGRRQSSSDDTPRPTPLPQPRHLGNTTHDTNNNVLGHTSSASDFFSSSKRLAIFGHSDKGPSQRHAHNEASSNVAAMHTIPSSLLVGRDVAGDSSKVLSYLLHSACPYHL
jgi:hypothetical protein